MLFQVRKKETLPAKTTHSRGLSLRTVSFVCPLRNRNVFIQSYFRICCVIQGFTKIEQLCLSPFFAFSVSETIPISLFLLEGQQVAASPPALHQSDSGSCNSDDENDDEDFHGVVMSPALSSVSDSSCSATDIGMLFCDAGLLCLFIS